VTDSIFLLSPANLSGKRGQQVMNPSGRFDLSRALALGPGAPVGEVFAFVSGLYFRGKKAYAEAFGRGLVMTAGGGLLPLTELVTPARLRGWAEVDVSHKNPHFTAPLVRHTAELLDRVEQSTRFVLLGSLATAKYTQPLLEILGEKLLFPSSFEGLGDMSRGALMLDAVRSGRELEYAPVLELTRQKTAR
jgi:hypothetical protein